MNTQISAVFLYTSNGHLGLRWAMRDPYGDGTVCVLQGLFACESTFISYKKFNSKIKKSSKNSGLLKNIIQTHLADTSD